jgi:hypothetical protein
MRYSDGRILPVFQNKDASEFHLWQASIIGTQSY